MSDHEWHSEIIQTNSLHSLMSLLNSQLVSISFSFLQPALKAWKNTKTLLLNESNSNIQSASVTHRHRLD